MRQSNIELLRIILMFMIILWHGLVHYCNNIFFENSTITETLLMSFSVIGVNCFISISAHFGIKFRLKSLVSFIIQASFYSIAIFACFKLIGANKYITETSYLEVLTPILHGRWWFLTTYIMLFLVAPLLNEGVKYIPQQKLRIIIICLLTLEILSPIVETHLLGGDGTTLFSFITIYIAVRYLSVYNITFKKPILIYIISSLILFFTTLTLLHWGYNTKAWHLFNYSSLFVIVGAISFLQFFKNMKLRESTFVNSVASLTFGVYLIHDHKSIRLFLQDNLLPIFNTIENPIIFTSYLLAITLCIFAICILIEKVRTLLCNPIVNFIYKGIDPN